MAGETRTATPLELALVEALSDAGCLERSLKAAAKEAEAAGQQELAKRLEKESARAAGGAQDEVIAVLNQELGVSQERAWSLANDPDGAIARELALARADARSLAVHLERAHGFGAEREEAAEAKAQASAEESAIIADIKAKAAEKAKIDDLVAKARESGAATREKAAAAAAANPSPAVAAARANVASPAGVVKAAPEKAAPEKAAPAKAAEAKPPVTTAAAGLAKAQAEHAERLKAAASKPEPAKATPAAVKPVTPKK